MINQVVLPAPMAQFLKHLQGLNLATLPVMGVFYGKYPGAGVVIVRRPDGFHKVGNFKHPFPAPYGFAGNTAQGCRARSFPIKDMAGFLADHFISGGSMGPYAYLVGHRARGAKKRSFVPQKIRGEFLQFGDGRIFLEYIVTHTGAAHGLQHRWGWLGHRVAS
jgi:hypothetical protein